MRRPSLALLSLLCAAACVPTAPASPAPAAQHPSPMVETTRPHERLVQRPLSGATVSFDGPSGRPVSVHVPAGARGRAEVPLVIHFHGAAWLPQQAVASLGDSAITAVVNLGAGSGAYHRPFAEASTFDSLLVGIARAVAGAGAGTFRPDAPLPRFTRITLSGFSAGHGAIRAILLTPRHVARVDAILLLDGMHTSYVPEGRVLSDSGTLDTTNLAAFAAFARAAVRGEKRFTITHSEIFPGTFASTTETADWIIAALGLRRTPTLRTGPRGMQQLSSVAAGDLTVLGFAGNTAPDHVDQFHAMPELLATLAPRGTPPRIVPEVVAPGDAEPMPTTGFPAPPNTPATITRTDSTVRIMYDGALILEARISAVGDAPDVRLAIDTAGGRVSQVIKWTARGRGGRVRLHGAVHASDEGFAAEPEPAEDSRAVVRHSVGRADNRRDRAVYDRQRDWLVSIDFPAATRISADTTPRDGVADFAIEAEGGEVAIRFRPRFYQRHRGLAHFAPWTYKPWAGSVTGWTSWYAFFDKVTEADIHRTADVMSEVLKPYGFTYLQIDDGYQQVPIGLPDHWLTTNAKFPSGLAALRRYIADRGLQPGIWTNVSFAQRDVAEANPQWFVKDANGRPAFGNWVGYVMDGSDPRTYRDLLGPVYDSMRSMGWTYFKLDALRHLRYEGYNTFAEYYADRRIDREVVFRELVTQVRKMVGPTNYLLACWGIRPELIGVVDGMRVGDDGFGYGAFAQYNSFNNVVWRNDPDHIELRQPDRYRATTLTSLTGSVMMLTDPPEVYRTDRVEAAKRTAPVLFTRPGQLYDVDASRSSQLHLASREVSGAGPRPFDADQRLTIPLYQVDIARRFEQWTVLARTGGDDPRVALTDLGLAPATEYVAFEFWTQRSLGVVRDTLRAPPIDPTFQVQAICLRRRVSHPQLLATDRHVTCGGVDLVDVAWRDRTLSGTSELVAGDPYVLHLTEVAGFATPTVSAEGAEVVSNARTANGRRIELRSRAGGRARWTVRYP